MGGLRVRRLGSRGQDPATRLGAHSRPYRACFVRVERKARVAYHRNRVALAGRGEHGHAAIDVSRIPRPPRLHVISELFIKHRRLHLVLAMGTRDRCDIDATGPFR